MPISIPRRLPLLVVTDNVLLPGSSMRIPVNTLDSINMVKSCLLGRNRLSSTVVGVIPHQSGSLSEYKESGLESLHEIGTAAVVVQATGTNWPTPSYTLLVTGLCRFKLEDLLQETPYYVARVKQLDRINSVDKHENLDEELQQLYTTFREHASKLVDMLDISLPYVAKLKKMMDNLPNEHFPDICASIVKASYSEKLQVLDAVDLAERFKKTLPLLTRHIEGLGMFDNIRHHNKNVRSVNSRPRNMRRAFQILPLKQDDEDDQDDTNDLEKKIQQAKMPAYAEKAAIRELKRLAKINSQMPEHAMIRSYLELMVELPWSKQTIDVLDISHARKNLDADHYALDSLKKRVIEYLAVRQLKNTLKGPILCFVGPPGVGKTSVGKSVAHTLGREFHRISLGGICDQSDIRGHRRTYIGSMPGRIIQGLNTAGTNNPVILLDEIDKMGKGVHGDPSSALLEVLDPEQNYTFTDHYLNVPFDLSQVLFIATANNLSTIPPPLLDRMEIITVPGYTQEEKLHIAIRHLIPKQLKEHGLTLEQLRIPEYTLLIIIRNYSYEAGVRQLERTIGAICRAVAVKIAEKSPSTHDSAPSDGGSKNVISEDLSCVPIHPSSPIPPESTIAQTEIKDTSLEVLALPPELPIVIDELALEDILGPRKFECEINDRVSQPGVAIGLAWTMMGGEIMYVESNKMEGDGKLILTGQLGDVMKESANLALNWVRSQAALLGILASGDLLEQTDLHIHFPAGAVSKDGPSAGVTIATVLVSLFTGRCVRPDTAMTGEITLRGIVLSVGGIKEKVLAAHCAGMKRIILPKRNEKDLKEVAANVKADMEFILVRNLGDVLNAAFEDGFPELVSHFQSKL